MERNELVKKQGWNNNSLLYMLEDFIEKKGLDDELDEFLQEMADQENQSDPKEDADARP